MASNSAIEWTESTWNPIVGCSILSPGCIHCYAMGEAARQIRCASGLGRDTHYAGTVKMVKGEPIWTGKLARAPEHILLQPLKRKKPTMYFVNSMSDLFHENVPDEWIDQVFAVMALCPQHTFQVLTKRAKRMRELLIRHRWHHWARIGRAMDADRWATLPAVMGGDCTPLPNVWLGVSTERQQEADERIPELLGTPAAVRFLSAEPLLGPIDLIGTLCRYQDGPRKRECEVALGRQLIDWVITGGESGSKARPSHPQWFRDFRDQCASTGIAYFHKQNGEWAPSTPEVARGNPRSGWQCLAGHPHVAKAAELYPEAGAAFVERVGKKAAGRMLDGVEHNGFPKVPA